MGTVILTIILFSLIPKNRENKFLFGFVGCLIGTFIALFIPGEYKMIETIENIKTYETENNIGELFLGSGKEEATGRMLFIVGIKTKSGNTKIKQIPAKDATIESTNGTAKLIIRSYKTDRSKVINWFSFAQARFTKEQYIIQIPNVCIKNNLRKNLK